MMAQSPMQETTMQSYWYRVDYMMPEGYMAEIPHSRIEKRKRIPCLVSDGKRVWATMRLKNPCGEWYWKHDNIIWWTLMPKVPWTEGVSK